jgi:3-methyladenine DNA glycosylase AlkD
VATAEQVVARLEALARPDDLEGMARYGMTTDRRLGVRVPELRKLAKEIGRDHELAQELWDTAIDDARILASMIDQPDLVNEEQMETWVKDFNSWDVCDQVCMNLFEKTPLAWDKVVDWSTRQEEFVKRAAYALIACLAWHDREAPDEAFVQFLPLIRVGATDGRNYVKKAVSWALRNIGKRNLTLHQAALEAAQQLKASDSKAARWIGSDVTRDLTSESTLKRLAKQQQ